jgi:hypothetical protein
MARMAKMYEDDSNASLHNSKVRLHACELYEVCKKTNAQGNIT